ncbi:hypothetical protein [Thiosocius teredinicola]|uniref:hypothetical protein n=1 Tax=Thiosocius teredinicola TaxID=1973002 RepID=UPI0009913BDF
MAEPNPSQRHATIKTLSPILVPFSFRTGTTDALDEYREFLRNIEDFDPALKVKAPPTGSQEYQNLSSDVRNLDIATWQDTNSEHDILFHVFPNAIAIVEITFRHMPVVSSEELEKQVQDRSRALIKASFQRFVELLKALRQSHPDPIFIDPSTHPANQKKVHIFWTSRALLLSQEQATSSAWKTIIDDWLALTQRPEDAAAITKGDLNCSMTWLNYVLVDSADGAEDFRIETMVLAQYIYTAQAQCNLHLKQAISVAYTSDRPLRAKTQLEESRVMSRLHQVTFNDHLGYMTRPKRKLLDEILESWEFEQLLDNGQRMIEVCTSRIEEASERQRERSSMLTDLLLVSLSFFAVFELSMNLTQFSREAMSRPTLDYNDDQPSFFLRLIAEIDTDIMFGFGVTATLLLVIVYRFLKSR